MQDLERQIINLKKPNPSRSFCLNSKKRLLNKIAIESSEKSFLNMFSSVFKVNPSKGFLKNSKLRLLNRINLVKKPFFARFSFLKNILTTSFVMFFAVSSVFFVLGGKESVSASENTYIEVKSGEAFVKHSNNLIWDSINSRMELSAGDIIRLNDTSLATIHFFDDSEVRLGENTVLLISKLDVSPVYDRQGIIELDLHKGRVWAQVLNADDGYAKLSIITPDIMVSAVKASFDVAVDLFNSTQLRVFKYSVDLNLLTEGSSNIVLSSSLNSNQKVLAKAISPYIKLGTLSSMVSLSDLTDEDKSDLWVKNNINADKTYLLDLKTRELNNIKNVTGTLPGEFLYPVKRAKERLELMLSFGSKKQEESKIDMANQRLNEAIMLFESGEDKRANLALMEYKKLFQEIIDESNPDLENEKINKTILTTYKKSLIATLPGDTNINPIKQALNQNEEVLAKTPDDLIEVKINNAIDGLLHVKELVSSGDIEAAKEQLALSNIINSSLLDDVNNIEDEELKKELSNKILNAQHAQHELLAFILEDLSSSKKLAATSFLNIVEDKNKILEKDIKHTAAVLTPILPDVVLSDAVVLPEDNKLIEFVNKVNIYKTDRGRSNQIKRLFKKYPQYTEDKDFLLKLKNKLNDNVLLNEINSHIKALDQEKIINKDREMRMKIDRARRVRR